MINDMDILEQFFDCSNVSEEYDRCEIIPSLTSIDYANVIEVHEVSGTMTASIVVGQEQTYDDIVSFFEHNGVFLSNESTDLLTLLAMTARERYLLGSEVIASIISASMYARSRWHQFGTAIPGSSFEATITSPVIFAGYVGDGVEYMGKLKDERGVYSGYTFSGAPWDITEDVVVSATMYSPTVAVYYEDGSVETYTHGSDAKRTFKPKDEWIGYIGLKLREDRNIEGGMCNYIDITVDDTQVVDTFRIPTINKRIKSVKLGSMFRDHFNQVAWRPANIVMTRRRKGALFFESDTYTETRTEYIELTAEGWYAYHAAVGVLREQNPRVEVEIDEHDPAYAGTAYQRITPTVTGDCVGAGMSIPYTCRIQAMSLYYADQQAVREVPVSIHFPSVIPFGVTLMGSEYTVGVSSPTYQYATGKAEVVDNIYQNIASGTYLDALNTALDSFDHTTIFDPLSSPSIVALESWLDNVVPQYDPYLSMMFDNTVVQMGMYEVDAMLTFIADESSVLTDVYGLRYFMNYEPTRQNEQICLGDKDPWVMLEYATHEVELPAGKVWHAPSHIWASDLTITDSSGNDHYVSLSPDASTYITDVFPDILEEPKDDGTHIISNIGLNNYTVTFDGRAWVHASTLSAKTEELQCVMGEDGLRYLVIYADRRHKVNIDFMSINGVCLSELRHIAKTEDARAASAIKALVSARLDYVTQSLFYSTINGFINSEAWLSDIGNFLRDLVSDARAVTTELLSSLSTITAITTSSKESILAGEAQVAIPASRVSELFDVAVGMGAQSLNQVIELLGMPTEDGSLLQIKDANSRAILQNIIDISPYEGQRVNCIQGISRQSSDSYFTTFFTKTVDAVGSAVGAPYSSTDSEVVDLGVGMMALYPALMIDSVRIPYLDVDYVVIPLNASYITISAGEQQGWYDVGWYARTAGGSDLDVLNDIEASLREMSKLVQCIDPDVTLSWGDLTINPSVEEMLMVDIMSAVTATMTGAAIGAVVAAVPGAIAGAIGGLCAGMAASQSQTDVTKNNMLYSLQQLSQIDLTLSKGSDIVTNRRVIAHSIINIVMQAMVHGAFAPLGYDHQIESSHVSLTSPGRPYFRYVTRNPIHDWSPLIITAFGLLSIWSTKTLIKAWFNVARTPGWIPAVVLGSLSSSSIRTLDTAYKTVASGNDPTYAMQQEILDAVRELPDLTPQNAGSYTDELGTVTLRDIATSISMSQQALIESMERISKANSASYLTY